MKRPALFVFIALLVVFGSFAAAQENTNTSSQPHIYRQKIIVSRQGQEDGKQYTDKRKLMDQGMMGQSSMMNCSGCIMNRVLAGSGNFYLDMSKSLGLTDAQIDELQQIRLNHAEQTSDLQGELYIAQLKLQDMLESDTIQINDADWKISEAYDLEAALQIEKVKSIIMARNVLTPSQRELVKSLTRRDMMAPNRDSGQEHRR